MANDINTPDIDLAALAIGGVPSPAKRAARTRRKRREAAALAKQRKARRDRLRRKRLHQRKRLLSTAGQAPLETRAAERRKTWTPDKGGDPSLYAGTLTLLQRTLVAAIPGEWATCACIGERSGDGRRAADPVIRQRGYFEKGLIADSEVRRPRVEGGGRPLETRFVWRLTAAGEAARELALLLV